MIQLQVGKTYYTRKDRKVEIFGFDKNPLIGGSFLGRVFFGKFSEQFNFYEDGRFLEIPGSMIDIVTENGKIAHGGN